MDTEEPAPQTPEPDQPGRRPFLRDTNVQQQLLASLRAGNPITTAITAIGLAPTTFHLWMRTGRQLVEEPHRVTRKISAATKRRYRDFYRAVIQAQAEAREGLCNVIANAAINEGDVESAKWMLERIDRRNFGSQVHLTVGEELNAILDRLEKELEPELFTRVARIMVGAPSEREVEAPPLELGAGAGAGAAPAAGLHPDDVAEVDEADPPEGGG